MQLQKAKNREKLWAVITVILLAGIFIFTVVIDPQLKKRQGLTEKLGQLQINLTRIKGDVLVKDRIDQIYSQIEPLIATTGTEQQQISAFTRQLSDIYSKLNVKIRSVKILPATNENFYKRLSIKIEMTGNVKDFLRFVQTVERHSEPIKIEQFDLKAKETRDNVQVSMVISKVVCGPKT
ncbi:type 4a pilus biogenesis protein PilO [Planctomycetota bacterium]